ncbi:MAG: Ty1/Copia family ribonuclease HI, partial [Nitrososphaerales archaeon]
VELGRIDIYFEGSKLSHHLCAPRVGHLEQAINIFAYLKQHLNSNIVFDPTEPHFDETRFTHPDWTDFYADAAEAIPPNMPEPRGLEVTMHCFVDADHAGDKLTRRSHSGIILYINRAPIIWFSKRQNTVETSTFGSEFIAMRMATEMIEGLRYKLWMFGIPISTPVNVFCDNQSVVLNLQNPESTMKKRHNAIAYHRVREAIAAGTLRVAKEDTTTNCADALTKSLNSMQRRVLMRSILW